MKSSFWLMNHLVNPMMRVLLRSPLHGLLSDSILLLTYRGKKSGKAAGPGIHPFARASRLMSSPLPDSRRLLLEAKDDGAGFDTTEAFPGHLGLRSMCERAERFCG